MARAMNLQIAACFVALQELSGGAPSKAFPYACPTLEFVKWAYCCVKSRAFSFDESLLSAAPAPAQHELAADRSAAALAAPTAAAPGAGGPAPPPPAPSPSSAPPGHGLIFMPFADLFNHSSRPAVQHAANADGSISFVASRHVRQGEQLTFQYSQKSEALDFLLNYGRPYAACVAAVRNWLCAILLRRGAPAPATLFEPPVVDVQLRSAYRTQHTLH